MPRRRPVAFGNFGASLYDSLGATAWEWLHPEQVRAEYEAVGKDPALAPEVTFADVLGAAREDALDTAREAGAELMSGTKKVVIALAIGAGVYIAWKVFGK